MSTPDPSQQCPRCHKVFATSEMRTLSKPTRVSTGTGGYKAVHWVCGDCWDEVMETRPK